MAKLISKVDHDAEVKSSLAPYVQEVGFSSNDGHLLYSSYCLQNGIMEDVLSRFAPDLGESGPRQVMIRDGLVYFRDYVERCLAFTDGMLGTISLVWSPSASDTRLSIACPDIRSAHELLGRYGYGITNFPAEHFGIKRLDEDKAWTSRYTQLPNAHQDNLCLGTDDCFAVTEGLLLNLRDFVGLLVHRGGALVSQWENGTPRLANVVVRTLKTAFPENDDYESLLIEHLKLRDAVTRGKAVVDDAINSSRGRKSVQLDFDTIGTQFTDYLRAEQMFYQSAEKVKKLTLRIVEEMQNTRQR